MNRFIVSLLFLILLSVAPVHAQTEDRPMILPVAGEPGPSTWLFGQAYGNTTGAYNFGQAWYRAGQGLHFGLDLSMPCGTPLVAVADGEVAFVDNLSFGSAPHNLILRHPALGYTTLYGHLLEPAPLIPGQLVEQGQIVGYSGDPDISCDSRPHLHFELRSLDYRTAYNPVPLIDTHWHILASMGAFGYPLFQQNLNNARQWMTLEDQPDVAFGGRRLNDYGSTWPLPRDLSPPDNPPLLREFTPLPENTTWEARQIGFDQCCWQHTWHPTDPDRLLVVDGPPGEQASVFAWSGDDGMMTDVLYPAPPPITSPDGTFNIYNNGGTTTIRHVSDGTEYVVSTQGVTPALSTDNSKLVWTVRQGATLPGAAAPQSTVWVSDINGENARDLFNIPGATARWLDADRLLVTISSPGRITTLSVYDTRDDSAYNLGSWRNLRGLSVSPGGEHLMFFRTWQGEDNTPAPEVDGVYLLETRDGAEPQRLPWFGNWQWRDAESVYFLPLDMSAATHTLAYYNITTGEQRTFTTPPFTIMNGDWEVSADGRRIVFQNATDRNMWLLEMTP